MLLFWSGRAALAVPWAGGNRCAAARHPGAGARGL